MTSRINSDEKRYLDIVRGKVRKELRKYLHQGKIEGQIDGDVIRIPLPRIDLPKIIHGSGGGGVGQGEGEEGDIIGKPAEEGDPAQAGDQEGEHMYEEFSLEEVAEIMAEEIELPNIKPKGNNNIYTLSDKLKTINKVGSPGRLNKRRSYREALKRSLAMNKGKKGRPKVVISKPDRRYRSFKPVRVPEMNALIFYMMDVSGSMGDQQKELVRKMSFWMDVWIKYQYQGVETRYIIHDASAKEVTRNDFFHTRESGGTIISSAYLLAQQIMERDYRPEDWNIYWFHFSDGDNWSSEDNSKCFKILDEALPFLNLFGYTQVKSPYGSGKFIEEIWNHYDKLMESPDSNVLTALLEDEEGIFSAIKDLLGKGI